MELFGWEEYLNKETIQQANKLFEQTNNLRNEKTIFPPKEQVFRALELTKPNKVKVIILGQDPYHGEHQATGLSFSIEKDCKLPPSLKNIFKEYEADLEKPAPETGDLSHWAQQGVLLLNTTLTVEQGKPNSHSKLGWNSITHDILRCALNQPEPACHVVLAWGMNAINEIDSVMKDIDDTQKENIFILKSTHPSPFSAKNTKTSYHSFMESKPFSRCNAILEQHQISGIDW